MHHKSGFISIIGSPNVGKSTLMNAFLGEKISIVTSKAQTTRHRILGIMNGKYQSADTKQDIGFQAVFSDTPGVLKPAYKLHEGMMRFVGTALLDSDVFLFVTDIYEKEFPDEKVLQKIKKSPVHKLVIINKIDLAREEDVEKATKKWKEIFNTTSVFPVSALKGTGVKEVFMKAIELLPESPPYFPEDELSDKPERFFVSEIIRERIFTNYKKEIPYSCEVVVEEFKETEDIIRIRVNIIVERNSQKGILIGHKGEKLKKLGTEARIEIEKFLGKKVFLESFVKVDKDWRNNEQNLKRFGYLA
jgi:GTPase